MLLTNSQPFISAEGDGFVAYIPTTAEIEEIKANDEGQRGEPPEPSAPILPNLTEEEWRIQESLRQLEESARGNGVRR